VVTQHVSLQIAPHATDVIANCALGATPVEIKVQHAPCPCLELFVARAADVEIFTHFNDDKVFALLNIHLLVLSHL